MSPTTSSLLNAAAGFLNPTRRRASLYFPTSWLALAELAQRMSRHVPALPSPAPLGAHRFPSQSSAERIEVVGYDFAEGELVRCKTYRWLPVADGIAVAARHPDLRPAALVCDTFASREPPRLRDRALFFQLTAGDSNVREKLFFCHAWGWSTADGLAQMLGFLQETFDLNLEPLLTFRQTTARHQLRFTLGLVAIGGDERRPPVTFYFWPV